MQSHSMLFMIVLLIVLPIMILFSNHDAFFVVTSFFMLISSSIQLFSLQSKNADMRSATEKDEETATFADMIGIDLVKIENGFKFSLILIMIVYFIYVWFYQPILWMKLLIALCIAIYLLMAVRLISPLSQDHVDRFKKLRSLVSAFVHASTLLIVISSFMIKYYE